MSKVHGVVLLSIILLLLAGCDVSMPCRSRGNRPGPPTGYWTVHQAYEQVRPAILAWHSDAVVRYVNAAFQPYRPGWDMRTDGTAPGWTFSVTSPGAHVATDVSFWDGQVYEGYEFGCGLGGDRGLLEIDVGPQPLDGLEGVYLRMDQAIGSDQAMAIAIAQGVSLEGLDHFELNAYEASWELVMRDPQTKYVWKQVIIDAVTGAVRRNDFAE